MAVQKDFLIKNNELFGYFGDDACVVIPDGIRTIWKAAFFENTKLQSVILPNTLNRIGVCAFSKCSNLKSITIPASVTFIDKCAFSDSGLEDVHIEGTPEIRLWAFDGTPYEANELKKHGGWIVDNVLLKVDPALTEYVIPPCVKTIGRDAFKNSHVKELDIPKGVTKLDVCAFSHSELERISLPNTVKSIGAYAFSGCAKLTELTIPKSVTDIDDGAFENLPNCVLTITTERKCRISEYAFGRNAQNVKEVRVPNGSDAMRIATKAGLHVVTFPHT